MTTVDPAMPLPSPSRRSLRRAVPLLLGPIVVYALLRPDVSSDAVALGIAGAIPVLYGIVVALVRRRIELFALVSGIGFSVAAVVSVLADGSSLPLKLDEAVITFAIGLVLLVAALIRRPLPIRPLLRMPLGDDQIDGPLGVAVGGFLVLHALVHVALAVELSTSSYLVLSRVVNWGTIVLGVLGLAAYRRHLSARR